MIEILLWLFLAAAGWFAYDTLRARELARAAGRRACEREGVQFLDDTVAGISLRLARNERGTLVPERTYRFEFSDTGNNRKEGKVVIRGNRLAALEMEPWQETVQSGTVIHIARPPRD
jgi:hypothetical protein